MRTVIISAFVWVNLGIALLTEFVFVSNLTKLHSYLHAYNGNLTILLQENDKDWPLCNNWYPEQEDIWLWRNTTLISSMGKMTLPSGD